MADTESNMENPVAGNFSPEHAAAAVVIGSLVALILIRRGFRGVNAGGIGVSIK